METLTSKTDYFECELDPNEFKRDPNARVQESWRFRDIPYYVCHIIMTLVFLVVSPMTVQQAWTRIRKETKKARRNLRRKYRQIRKYGLFGAPGKKEGSYRLSTSFITDKMLSSSEEDESSTEGSSSGEYQSPLKTRRNKGVFTA